MKTKLLKLALCAFVSALPLGAWAQTASTVVYGAARSWNFGKWSKTTLTNLAASGSGWTSDTNGYKLSSSMSSEGNLTANGAIIGETKGLVFYGKASNLLINTNTCRIRFASDTEYLKIPNLKSGQTVVISAASTNSNPRKMVAVEGSGITQTVSTESTGSTVEYTFTVSTDGDYTFKTAKASGDDTDSKSMYIYSVEVSGLSTITTNNIKAWSFSSWDSDEMTAIQNDINYKGKWTAWDEKGYYPQTTITTSALSAKGTEIAATSGLTFTTTQARALRIHRSSGLYLQKNNATIIVPRNGATTNWTIEIVSVASGDNAVAIVLADETGISKTSGEAADKYTTVTNVFTISSEQDSYSFKSSSGDYDVYVKSIKIKNTGGVIQNEWTFTSVDATTLANLAYASNPVTWATGSDRYYWKSVPSSTDPWAFSIDGNELSETRGLTFTTSSATQFRIVSSYILWIKNGGVLNVPASDNSKVVLSFKTATSEQAVKIEPSVSQIGLSADPGNTATTTNNTSTFNVSTGGTGTYMFKVDNASADVYLYSVAVTEPAISGYPVTISAAKYATFSYPEELTAPAGITAYYISDKEGETSVTATPLTKDGSGNTVIPAGQAVILYANVDEPTTYYLTRTTTGASKNNSYLRVNYAPTEPTATTYYTLAVDGSGNPVFRKSSGGVLGANKAYLDISTDAASRELNITFDDNNTTAITTMQNSQSNMHNEYYNLSGQRVAQPTKGLYIVNGKKVIIK